jgi:hypothetical protein
VDVPSSTPPTTAALPDLSRFDAVLFDLDGVLTPTAEVHRRAWRALFGDYLARRGAAPYEERDYYEHLDGRQRYAGVERLLASRGNKQPRGHHSPAASPRAAPPQRRRAGQGITMPCQGHQPPIASLQYRVTSDE